MPSLCCKRRLKAAVCQVRNRYRQFEFNSLHQSVLRFSYLAENRSKSACACDLRSRTDPESVSDGANRKNLAKPIRVRFCQVRP